MRTFPLLGAAAAAALLISPAVQAQGGARNAAPAIRSEMLVTTEWLAGRLSDTNVVVLHVSSSRDGYDKAHVPGARFVFWRDVAVTRNGIPNELPTAEALSELFGKLGVAPGRRIVIYSEDPGLMAARVYVALDYMGAGDRAALLDGQWAKWLAENRPTTTEVPAAATSRFVPRVRSDAVVSLNAMRDLVWESNTTDRARVAIVDARSEAEYQGDRAGEGVPRAGHIPGAASIFWMRNVQDADNPVLKPVAELRRMYEEAGARADGLVVTYCRTGGQASHAYFTARYLGYDVKIYDGSFIEWSRDSETTVATAVAR